ncbi:hypothetical protein SRABI112_05179 [Pseudomonas mediterranea]|nr:hypothetical protein SRABI112_05179 [Pseudomonas mediterranea]
MWGISCRGVCRARHKITECSEPHCGVLGCGSKACPRRRHLGSQVNRVDFIAGKPCSHSVVLIVQVLFHFPESYRVQRHRPIGLSLRAVRRHVLLHLVARTADRRGDFWLAHAADDALYDSVHAGGAGMETGCGTGSAPDRHATIADRRDGVFGTDGRASLAFHVGATQRLQPGCVIGVFSVAAVDGPDRAHRLWRTLVLPAESRSVLRHPWRVQRVLSSRWVFLGDLAGGDRLSHLLRPAQTHQDR